MSIRGYIDLALAALILLLVIAALWLWKGKDNAQADLIAAQTVHTEDVRTHEEDQAEIKAVTAFKSANDHILADFVSKFAAIDRDMDKLNGQITHLRQTNADVERYLSTPIPKPLLDVLNGLCEQTAGTAEGCK